MKFLLPMVAVLVMAGFFGASLLNATLPDNVVVDNTAIQGGKLVMDNLVLTGQNKDGKLYKMTAARAIQALSDPNLVHLEDIVATLPVGDGKNAKVTAKSAIFNRDRELISFDKPFNVATETGMTARLEKARFDIKAGLLTSGDPIQISSDRSDLVARSMRMRDDGQTLEFNDNVKMTIQPSTLKPEVKDEAPREK